MAKVVARVFLYLLLLAIGGAAGFAAAKLLSPNDASTIMTSYEDWRLVCPPIAQSNCHADEDVVDARTGAILVRLVASGPPAARLLTITLPHNLLIPPGISLVVGTTPAVSFPYDLCDHVGCIVPIRVDANGEAKLRGAQRGSITVINVEDKPATVQFSLHGLGSALDALDRAEAARASWWRKILS